MTLMNKNLKSEKEQTGSAKILTVLIASLFALVLGVVIVCLIDLWDVKQLGAEYETSLVTTILGTTFLVCCYLVIVAMIAILIYYFLIRKTTAKLFAQPNSPLQNLTKDQERCIIDTLKTFAQPLPGKSKLNRARTTQFLRALTELGYIDANLDGKIIMPWVEYVTGYIDGELGHFNDQYKKASTFDKNVKLYMTQITQLLNTQA